MPTARDISRWRKYQRMSPEEQAQQRRKWRMDYAAGRDVGRCTACGNPLQHAQNGTISCPVHGKAYSV